MSIKNRNTLKRWTESASKLKQNQNKHVVLHVHCDDCIVYDGNNSIFVCYSIIIIKFNIIRSQIRYIYFNWNYCSRKKIMQRYCIHYISFYFSNKNILINIIELFLSFLYSVIKSFQDFFNSINEVRKKFHICLFVNIDLPLIFFLIL